MVSIPIFIKMKKTPKPNLSIFKKVFINEKKQNDFGNNTNF